MKMNALKKSFLRVKRAFFFGFLPPEDIGLFFPFKYEFPPRKELDFIITGLFRVKIMDFFF